jgi:hypothetical protein
MPDRKRQETNRLQDTKQKKDDCQKGAAGDDIGGAEEAESKKRAEAKWTDIVGQRIEQAMHEGAFENLPGNGKPLNLNKNPYVPEDRQMAYKLLENNDLAPGWIRERTSTLSVIEAFRGEIHTAVHTQLAALQGTTDHATIDQLRASWTTRLATWRDTIIALNKRIESVNIQQPIVHLEIIKLRLSSELTKAGADEELLPPI